MMKTNNSYSGACYQVGMIGSLYLLKRFRSLFIFQAEIRINFLSASTYCGSVYYSAKKAAVKGKPPPSAKCATDVA